MAANVLHPSKTAVLGAGAWGTALGIVLARKGVPTVLWAHEAHVAAEINETRCNRTYLPGAADLPATLSATPDLQESLHGADHVVLVVPSHAVREVMTRAKPLLPRETVLCSATKGIENSSLMLMSEVIEDVLGMEWLPRMTFLSGPSFAQEVASDLPTAVVVAGAEAHIVEGVQRHFASERFRVYGSQDVTGVELGGAIKNVIAIAAGAADGLGFGHNARAGLITRGLNEIGRLALRKGANPLTLSGLAGMGDLVLTCTGELSRNRTVGIELGRGRKLADILAGLGHVAEGVKTAKSVYDLSVQLEVELPICTEVYRVLYEDKPAAQAVTDLLSRALRWEQS